MKRGITLITALLVVMLLVTAGSVYAAKAKPAEPVAPVAPAVSVFDNNTEAYYEVRCEWLDIKNTMTDSFARLQKIEIAEPLFKMLNSEIGISLENDVFSWIGNTIRIGVVGDDNSSVIHDGLEYMFTTKKSQGELTITVSNMKNIGTALEMYSTDYNGKYPAKLEKLAPNYLKSIPKPARGGEYKYWANKKKTAYVVKVPADMFKDMGMEGDKLQYNSAKGLEGYNPIPGKTYKFHNYMMAVDVRDMEKAVPALARIEKSFNNKTTGKDEAFPTEVAGKYVIHNGQFFSYSFVADQFVIADSSDMIKKAIASSENPGKNMLNSKLFQSYINACPKAANHNELYFINLEKINLDPKFFRNPNKGHAMHYHGDGLCACDAEKPNEADYAALNQTIKGLSYIAGYTKWDKQDIYGEFQLRFKPDANIGVMKKYFATKAYDGTMMDTLPSGLPLAAVYNAGELINFVNSLGLEIPALKSEIDEFKSKASMAIGMDIEKDIIASTTGEVGVTYMLRDVFIGTIISLMTEFKSMKAPSGNPGNEAPASSVEKEMKALNKFPITFFVGVKDSEKVGKLMDLLKTKITFTEEKYKDVTIYKSPSLVYCMVGDKLLLHTYPSTIQVKEFIDKLNSKTRLGDTSKYREFKKDINGRILLIQFHDTEWAMALAKGFYLLFLPEYSDYAEKMADFRESWSSVSVTPNGFNFNFRMFSK
jgi:hypothetical protein